MDFKLELVPVPVADIDRSIAFYTEKLGFSLDIDAQVNESLRFTQVTPPGSACSILLDAGINGMTPGTVKGLQLVISDADAAHAQLVSKGVETSAIQPLPWGRFITFADPDGNTWALQESPNRVNPPA